MGCKAAAEPEEKDEEDHLDIEDIELDDELELEANADKKNIAMITIINSTKKCTNIITVAKEPITYINVAKIAFNQPP